MANPVELTLTRPDPASAQRRAANPTRSVWVSASAGTGKTKVLTDRVLSLLLTGTPPHKILCLTFTRAAAAEMANRINSALAGWAVAEEDKLAEDIKQLIDRVPEPEMLQRARPLFARVLDVPGGMKIQTLHGFCESLLGRFPLEAGLAPHFEVMDERDATEGLAEAQVRVLGRARAAGDDPLATALADVTGHINEIEFAELLANLSTERGRLRRLFDRHGGTDSLALAVFTRLGIPVDATVGDTYRAASAKDAVDTDDLRRVAAAMLKGSKTDQKHGDIIASWLAASESTREKMFDRYASAFFTTTGAMRKTLIHKDSIALAPDGPEIMAREALRLEQVMTRIRAIVTAQATSSLLTLAEALLDAYEGYKRDRGRLDYDDLILRARRLLEHDGGASWVLFKLDGGIDHILIDEAQDTNPDQWAVVRALAEEFFSGLGAQERDRTVFAVGDPKQSIYSFQRAAPEEFEKMRNHFRTRVAAAEKAWDDVDLDISFRSTEPILRSVDTVFATAEARDGLADPDQEIHHEPFRQGQAGLVELWPPVSPEERDEPEAWAPPVVARQGDHPATRLASVIAGRIDGWLDSGEQLESQARPIRPGDIMVLVRRRGAFVEELVRALKQRSIPVAGIDRMVLGEQLAVRDLLALGGFLLLPEDDLTLATVLKGPLFGLSEDELFDLAYNRGDHTLWQVLRTRAGEKPVFKTAVTELDALLARVDYVAPFELFADVLARRRGRALITGRLGRDANDPLDEFLARAFTFERNHAPSLQAFLHSLETDPSEIKRDLEQAMRDEVRVMTIHGSKGLQAPIVFLPDTLQIPVQRPTLLWTDDDLLLWPPRRRFAETVCEAAIEEAVRRRNQEYQRLLYVAMTRAEDRLYVCGWHTSRKAPAHNWYDLIAAALEPVASPVEFDLTLDSKAGWQGPGLRLDNTQEARASKADDTARFSAAAATLPDWATRPPSPENVPPTPLTPSRPDNEPAPRSPMGGDGGAGFRRGLLVHRLLQILAPPRLRVFSRGGCTIWIKRHRKHWPPKFLACWMSLGSAHCSVPVPAPKCPLLDASAIA
jgi:ATP-dependent helicase/nuclease subunit A